MWRLGDLFVPWMYGGVLVGWGQGSGIEELLVVSTYQTSGKGMMVLRGASYVHIRHQRRRPAALLPSPPAPSPTPPPCPLLPPSPRPLPCTPPSPHRPQVDPARNLLYVRGQVPGPSGRFVYLRDAFNVTHEFRSKWGVPFPTYVGDPAVLPVSVYRSEKDPYRMYREETDYFPIEWKKGE